MSKKNMNSQHASGICAENHCYHENKLFHFTQKLSLLGFELHRLSAIELNYGKVYSMILALNLSTFDIISHTEQL